MKILIAGGTGFIGTHAAKLLKSQGHEVKTLSRSGEIKADVTKLESLQSAPINDFDALIICVQFPNHPVEQPSKGYTYDLFDAQGTENICKLVKTSNIKKIVYISGAGTSTQKQEPWFKAKVRAEHAVQNCGKDFVILRPSWVYGPGDKSMSKFLAFTKLPFMPVIGDGLYQCAPLFIEDLAKIIALATTNDHNNGEIIEVGGPENLTMLDIQRRVLEFKNKKRPLIKHPICFMKIVGFFMNAFLPRPPLSPNAVDFVTMNQPVDTSNVEKYFNFKPKLLKEGLAFYK